MLYELLAIITIVGLIAYLCLLIYFGLSHLWLIVLSFVIGILLLGTFLFGLSKIETNSKIKNERVEKIYRTSQIKD